MNSDELKLLNYEQIIFPGPSVKAGWDEHDSVVMIWDCSLKDGEGKVAYLSTKSTPAEWFMLTGCTPARQIYAAVAMQIGCHIAAVNMFIRKHLPELPMIPADLANEGWRYDILGRLYREKDGHACRVPTQKERDHYAALVSGYDWAQSNL